MTLNELRKAKGLTQAQCAEILGMPLRTYQSYESREKKGAVDLLKYKYICAELEKYGLIDEEHGILTISGIKETSAEVFEKSGVECAYLFGSYAKGNAQPMSDVDLLVCGSYNSIQFYGMAEWLRTVLKKNIDLLDRKQLLDNELLLDEILKYGIKIYG